MTRPMQDTAEREAEVDRMRTVCQAAGVIRNLRLAIDTRLTSQERRIFDDLSEAFDAWKFPDAPPPTRGAKP